MYPMLCACGHLQMIDLDILQRRTIDKLHEAEGYQCSGCGDWVTVFITTPSLDQAMQRLEHRKASRPDFRFHLLKVLKKATAIQKANSYG